MGVPATTGQLRTNINDMEIGDYIIFSYYTGSLLVHEVGTSTKTEMPLTGLLSSSGLTQSAYFVKVDNGLLISDRVCGHTITWDSLNSSKKIQGDTLTLNGKIGIVRSLSGGIAFIDNDENLSMTNKNIGGFPINNEWDRYIMNFPKGKIQSGKTLDDIFHIDRTLNSSIPYTWVQETPTIGFVSVNSVSATNAHRTVRVKFNESFVSHLASNTSGNYVGFRPVFEYKE